MRSPSSLLTGGLLLVVLAAGLPGGCADSEVPEPVAPEFVETEHVVLAGERTSEARVGFADADVEVDRDFELRLSFGSEAPGSEAPRSDWPGSGPLLVEYGALHVDELGAAEVLPAAGRLRVAAGEPVTVTLTYAGTLRAPGRRAWARVVEPGWQQRLCTSTTERVVDADGVARRRSGVTLHAWPGATLRGRVVGPDGASVAGARVELTDEGARVEGPDRARAGRTWRSWLATSEDGAFELHTARTGRVDIAAWAEGIGVGRARSIPVDPLDPPQDLVVRLGGDGVIRGIVRDQRGRPVPGVTFSAFVVEDEAQEPDPLAVGLSIGSTTSDALGLVEIRGLVHGRYYVILDGAYDLVTEDGHGFVEADTRAHDRHVFRVATRRIEVTCVDAAGEPVAWHPEVRLGEARRGGRRGLPLEYRLEGWEDAGGANTEWRPTGEPHTWALWVGADGKYRIILGDRARGWVSHDVEVDLESDPARLEVTLPEPRELATLEVEVPPALHATVPNGLHVHAVHPDHTTPILGASTDDPRRTVTATWPAGTYHLTITTGAAYAGHDGAPMFAAIVELEPGETHRLVLSRAHQVPD